MNWSSEWKNSPGFAAKLDAEFNIAWPKIKPEDVVIGPTFDGNVWQHPTTLSIIANKGDFPTQVQAIQVGDLAVHDNVRLKTDNLESGNWQVTHVPTNTRFNAVPEGLHEKAALIEWCKKVQEQLVDDWTALKELTADNYSIKIAAKDRVKAMCLETEV